MKQKHIFRALLAIVLVAVLALGGWGLDILINGNHLPLSHESVRKVQVHIIPPYLHLSDYPEMAQEDRLLFLDNSDPEDQKIIREALSLLEEFRYAKIGTNEDGARFSDVWCVMKITYRHHQESFWFFPDRVRRFNSLEESTDSPTYLGKNPEKFREKIERFAEIVYGEKNN